VTTLIFSSAAPLAADDDSEAGDDKPEAKLAASAILRILVVCPIPSCGRPLFRPSRSKQALHSSFDEMYPHRVQLAIVGNFVDSFACTDADNASPE
jgi:hypothetical protein